MDIAEAVTMKKALELEITRALREFEKQTKLSVDRVEIEKEAIDSTGFDSPQMEIVSVKMGVRLQ